MILPIKKPKQVLWMRLLHNFSQNLDKDWGGKYKMKWHWYLPKGLNVSREVLKVVFKQFFYKKLQGTQETHEQVRLDLQAQVPQAQSWAPGTRAAAADLTWPTWRASHIQKALHPYGEGCVTFSNWGKHELEILEIGQYQNPARTICCREYGESRSASAPSAGDRRAVTFAAGEEARWMLRPVCPLVIKVISLRRSLCSPLPVRLL